MQGNEKDKKELAKAAEDELVAILENRIDTWEQGVEVTLVLGFMVMNRNSFDILGGRMVIYPEYYKNAKIHLNALQIYCEGLKETI